MPLLITGSVQLFLKVETTAHRRETTSELQTNNGDVYPGWHDCGRHPSQKASAWQPWNLTQLRWEKHLKHDCCPIITLVFVEIFWGDVHLRIAESVWNWPMPEWQDEFPCDTTFTARVVSIDLCCCFEIRIFLEHLPPLLCWTCRYWPQDQPNPWCEEKLDLWWSMNLWTFAEHDMGFHEYSIKRQRFL